MKKQRFGLLAVLITLMGLMASSVLMASLAPAWKVINEENGITVSTKSIEGSHLHAFKGEAVIAGPLQKVLWVLMNNEHRKNWVDRLKYSHVIESISSHEYVIQQEFDLPWPISDREYIYRGKATRNEKTGAVTLSMKSVESDKAAPSKAVRGDLQESYYILTPREDGKTKIEVMIQTDAKGSIPSWLANLIQKKWPTKTLKAIEAELGKEYVKEAVLP